MKPVIFVLALALVACGDDDSGNGSHDAGVDADFVLTVTGRPAIRDVALLKITVSGLGAMRTDDIPVSALPATVPYQLPTSPLAWSVSIEARTSGDVAVGLGSASFAAGATTGAVQLDPTDFVVNTAFAGDQFLSTDYEAVGVQLAADATGTFTVAFRDDCGGNTSSCNMYARRFDATGDPQGTVYTVSSSATTSAAQPAVATLANGISVVVWDYTEPVGGNRGIGCRAISATGTLSAQQLSLTSDPADVVSAVALANGDVAVTWQIFSSPTYLTRGTIVHADCTQAVAPFTITSTAPSTGTFGATRPHVASTGASVVFSWITDDNLWIRTATASGLAGAETKILDKTTSQTIEHVRIVPYGTGYAAFVRWVNTAPDLPGKLEMYPLTTTGTLGPPILISDQTRSDFPSNKAFGAAYLPADGAVVVAWHTCTGAGLCDVYARVVDASGTLTAEVTAPTRLAGEQINPSVAALPQGYVAAWTDSSGEAPDQSGTSVRARIFYRP